MKGENPAILQDIELFTVNGLNAARGYARINSSSGPIDFQVVGVRFNPSTGYHFIFVTPGRDTQRWQAGFNTTTNSFRKLSREEADTVYARRVKIFTVQRGDTISSLARQMAYDDRQMERFMVLNGMREGDVLRQGQKVKIIVYANG